MTSETRNGRAFLKPLALAGLWVLLALLLVVAGGSTPAQAATFTVDSTGDGGDSNTADGVCDDGTGACTLRAAIEQANASAGADTINFSIGGGGVQTISPGSALPDITDQVTIDGTTQPGFVGSPIIELEGSGAGADANGLSITAGGSTVKGLVINRFAQTSAPNTGNGILVETGGGNTIEGNYLGTDVTGTVDLGNDRNGVFIRYGSNNTIGGTTAAARNIISGNLRGVRIVSSGVATENVVQGNYIGTDVTGTVALGSSNEEAVLIRDATNTTIGGTAAGARNIIAGFVGISGSAATGNVVQGNYIGTDVTGTVNLAGSAGVQIFFDASGNTIGGTTAAARNIISGSGGGVVNIRGSDNVVQGNYIGTDVTGTVGPGGSLRINGHSDIASNNTIGGTTAGARNIISRVRIGGSGATGNVVQGNYIGTDVTGTVGLGYVSGVWIGDGAANNTIGGTTSGAGNIIAFSLAGFPGVRVTGTPDTTGNAILSNSIFSNGTDLRGTGLGIDLAPSPGSGDGVTVNDVGDGDIGPNNLQNYPVLTSAVSGSTNIEGSLNSTANTEFRVEFFANAACDVSGNGEGETFLGFDTVTTDGTGNVSFSVNLAATVAAGEFVTATATDPAGNTSEFSECVEVPAGNTQPGTDVCVPLAGGLEICFSEVSGGGDTTVVTSGAGPPPPTGFRVIGSVGQPVYYDFNTTATFSGTVTVCIAYDGTQVGNESNLKLKHFDGGWADITTSLDTTNDIICGETLTLSPFAVMVPILPSVGGIVELVYAPPDSPQRQAGGGTPAWPAVAALAGVSVMLLGGVAIWRRRRA